MCNLGTCILSLTHNYLCGAFIYIISVSAKQLHCKNSVLNATYNQIKKAIRGLYKSLERFCFVMLIIYRFSHCNKKND